MNERLVTISKFLSKHLRHDPYALGLTLEPGGWVEVERLLLGAAAIGFAITHDELRRVVAENDKQRFAFNADGSRIRANQGHSTAVDLQLSDAAPPERLYHGTVAALLDSIRTKGLNKMKRHDVHLSPDVETALKVGGRRGKPIVLVIESGKMAVDGYKFRLSANGVWLTDHVPPGYIHLLAERHV